MADNVVKRPVVFVGRDLGRCPRALGRGEGAASLGSETVSRGMDDRGATVKVVHNGTEFRYCVIMQHEPHPSGLLPRALVLRLRRFLLEGGTEPR